MSTLSVPLSPEVEKAIQKLIDLGFASNRAEAARKSILKAEEEMAVAIVLESEQCVKEGKLLQGNPKELLQKIA